MKKQILMQCIKWFGFGAVAMTLVYCVAALVFILMLIGALAGQENSQAASNATGSGRCSAIGAIDESAWNQSFKKAGALKDKGDVIKRIAEEQGIDPVLFAAIAFHETAWGSSNAVMTKNNPGGLMYNGGGLMVFPTLDDGLASMGRTLHNRIVKDGKNTIEKLGSVYAPVGADNDPQNSNQNWVPTTTAIVGKLGGLTKNCDSAAGGKSEASFIIPIDNPVVTSGFGPRWGTMHKGQDFGMAVGTPVKAAKSGKVVVTMHLAPSGSGYGGYGNVVQIEHGDGKWTLYAHLSEVLVTNGQDVKQGDVIAKSGNTGDSTGPHLHFEIRTEKSGGQIDPAPLLGL